LDGSSGTRIATVRAGDVDGLAYDPVTQRVFVSDESGGRVTVIDARTNRRLGAIALGGEAGNTQYDSVSRHMFVGVQTRNELAEIDPSTLKVIRRFELQGCQSSHSVSIDAGGRAAYIGCQQNVRLVRLDLQSGRVTASGPVGIGVDVLAFDASRHRLYVASESGIVSVYDVANGGLTRIAQAFLALHAHVVAVDPATHRVYFPLQDVHGKPMLRVMEPL
jgi:DNA-binding beta-propeller fold protein YncE